MNRVRIKICGIKTLEEANAAVEAGADALGFNFWTSSPRYITPDAAKLIIERLSPFVCNVGVFVNEDAEVIERIASATRISAVQLHGDESPEFCARLNGWKVIKAVRVDSEFNASALASYNVSAILLDASVKGNYGGTGRIFDWNAAIEAKKCVPIILAGGLTVENVREAIRRVRPLAVDVCSGVEAEPGRKDLNKLRNFIAAAAASYLEVDQLSGSGTLEG